MSLLCRLRGHKVNRKRVSHDGAVYRTNCQRCGCPMYREWDGWKEGEGHEVATNSLEIQDKIRV